MHERLKEPRVRPSAGHQSAFPPPPSGRTARRLWLIALSLFCLPSASSLPWELLNNRYHRPNCLLAAEMPGCSHCLLHRRTNAGGGQRVRVRWGSAGAKARGGRVLEGTLRPREMGGARAHPARRDDRVGGEAPPPAAKLLAQSFSLAPRLRLREPWFPGQLRVSSGPAARIARADLREFPRSLGAAAAGGGGGTRAGWMPLVVTQLSDWGNTASLFC